MRPPLNTNADEEGAKFVREGTDEENLKETTTPGHAVWVNGQGMLHPFVFLSILLKKEF